MAKKGTSEPSSLAGSASCSAVTRSLDVAVGVGEGLSVGDGEGSGLGVGEGMSSELRAPASEVVLGLVVRARVPVPVAVPVPVVVDLRVVVVLLDGGVGEREVGGGLRSRAGQPGLFRPLRRSSGHPHCHFRPGRQRRADFLRRQC